MIYLVTSQLSLFKNKAYKIYRLRRVLGKVVKYPEKGYKNRSAAHSHSSENAAQKPGENVPQIFEYNHRLSP